MLFEYYALFSGMDTGVFGLLTGGGFAFLGIFFINTSLKWIHFPSSRAKESVLKFDSEAVNDVLVVHGFSIGYKAEFTGSGYFPWSARLPSAPRW